MRRTRAEIDLGALESNVNLIRNILGKNVGISAVVKGNAYGHGILGVSKKLESLNIGSLSVAFTDEGIYLRENGIKTPIVLIAPFYRNNIKDICRFNLIPIVYDFTSLAELNSYAGKKDIAIPVHIKIDSGMNRLGFKAQEIDRLLEELKNSKGLNPLGISSHFYESDNPDQHSTQEQLKIFISCGKKLSKALKISSLKHIANSSAVAASQNYHLDMVRPGLALYGYTMSKNSKFNCSLKKVLSLKSWVAMIKNVNAGESVGYSRAFVADKNYRIGIIPLGYADGYLRKYMDMGYLLIKGKRAKLIGSVCMDMLFCDLTEIPLARVGDDVTLIGRDGKLEISAADYASACGTIPYEILTAISQRVPRVFIDRKEM